MPKSLVQVSRFNRPSTNGHAQVILNVIDGAEMPNAVAIQIESFATKLGLKIGDQTLIVWRETGEEEIIRAGKRTGEYRKTYSLFKVGESTFTGTFLETLAVESAKALVTASLDTPLTNRRRAVTAAAAGTNIVDEQNNTAEVNDGKPAVETPKLETV